MALWPKPSDWCLASNVCTFLGLSHINQNKKLGIGSLSQNYINGTLTTVYVFPECIA